VTDPFRRIQINPQHTEYLHAFGPAAGVVVGLALRFAKPDHPDFRIRIQEKLKFELQHSIVRLSGK
jgi:hypothetical protein